MQRLLILVFVVMAAPSFGAIFGVVRTEGTVRDFDEQKVVFVDEQGTKFSMERKYLPKDVKIRSGEKITIEQTYDQFKERIRYHK